MPERSHSDLIHALESNDRAELEAVGTWWASGMQTRRVDSQVARLLVERGATLTPHAAAGLGLRDHLAELLDRDPSSIDAKGGGGCTPLHFSRDVETARIAFPSESAGAEPWSGPFDHAAPVRPSASTAYVGPQHEIELPPAPPPSDQD